tara:strand:+ start:148 stop:312 length:165 start_codon:yes stop_codon:yes gene_type:complete
MTLSFGYLASYEYESRQRRISASSGAVGRGEKGLRQTWSGDPVLVVKQKAFKPG